MRKGFTLIELLVVISLIAILSTLVMANLNAARERGRDAQRKADLRSIQTALRLYYNDNSSYPNSDSFINGSDWKSGSTVYMNAVPKDPQSGSPYVYTYNAADDTYTLYACLENKTDSKGIVKATCATSEFAYEVKS